MPGEKKRWEWTDLYASGGKGEGHKKWNIIIIIIICDT